MQNIYLLSTYDVEQTHPEKKNYEKYNPIRGLHGFYVVGAWSFLKGLIA